MIQKSMMLCRISRQIMLRPLTTTTTSSSMTTILPDPSLVDARMAPSDFTPDCAVVYPDFVTATEGDLLVNDLFARMKRRRYEKGHWDAAITNYKEVEMTDFLDEPSEIPGILKRVRQQLELHLLTTNQRQEQEQEQPVVQWLPCHAIDLKREGALTAHVDSIKFSGDLVAGLSLRSASIMRLMIPEDDYEDDDDDDAPADGKVGHVDLYLPPLSLYVLTGVGRYRYSHQLLPDQSTFCHLGDGNNESIVVPRDHRLSVIFRDAKSE